MNRKLVLLPILVLVLTYTSSVNANPANVVRSFSQTVITPNTLLNVTISIDIEGEDYITVDELIPEGWTLVSSGGLDTSEAGHLKFLALGTVIPDQQYTYTLKAPESTGSHLFTGSYQAQGMDNPSEISGSTSVKIFADQGTYYPSNNTCETFSNNFKITTENCHAQDADGRDITQYVTFHWLGQNELGTKWVFAYTQNLSSGSLYLWNNQSYPFQTFELVNATANITIHDVQQIENVGSPSTELCDIGNEWNSIARMVTTSNSTQTVYCFNEYGQYNSTSYWLKGTYYKYESTPTTKYKMGWSDVTNQVSYEGNNLLGNQWNYYTISQATFQPDESIRTKWVFTPSDKIKNGKWHIFGWKSDQLLSSAIHDDLYIYQDPFWNESWNRRIPIEINASVSESNIQIKFPIQYDTDMNSDFSDLRFLNNCSEDAVELYAWNESTIPNTRSVIWVNLGDNPTNRTICMYYNNPLALPYWDGSNTFIYYSDFHQLSTGELVGQDSWVDAGSGTGYWNIGGFTPYEYNQSLSIITTDNNQRRIKRTLGAGTTGYPTGSVGFIIRGNGTNFYGSVGTLRSTDDYDNAYTRFKDNEILVALSSNYQLFNSVNTNEWYKINHTWINTTGMTLCAEHLPANETHCAGSTMYSARSGNTGAIYFQVNDFTNAQLTYGAVYFANYTSVQKTITFLEEEAGEDTTPPTWSSNSTNSTTVGSDISHNLYLHDDVELAEYIFGFDNGTGTLVNDTQQAISAQSTDLNITKTINSTLGSTIRWQVFFNDTSGNSAITPIFQYQAEDTAPPILTINQPWNTTYYNNTIAFEITANEDISWMVVEIDGSNSTNFTWTGSTWTFVNNTLSDNTYQAVIWANDTYGNLGSTQITFTINTQPPTITILYPENKTYYITDIWFNVTTDKTADWCAVDYGFGNTTMQESQNVWYHRNQTVSDATYQTTFWCNDTSGNLNHTSIIFSVNSTHIWWNYTFKSRIQLNINSTVTTSGVQVRINKSYETEMQPDFSDLRLLSNCSYDAVELYAYNESQVNGQWITFWLNTSTIGTNPSVPYCLYYENATPVDPVWDGNKTFEYYQHFNDLNLGSILEQDGWANDVDGSNIKILDETSFEGNKTAGGLSTIAQQQAIKPITQMNDGNTTLTIYMSANTTGTHGHAVLFGYTGKGTYAYYKFRNGALQARFGAEDEYESLMNYKANSWYRVTATFLNKTTWQLCAENKTTENGGFDDCFHGKFYHPNGNPDRTLDDGIPDNFKFQVVDGDGSTKGYWDNVYYANTTQGVTYYFGEAPEFDLGAISSDSPVDPTENSTTQIYALANASGSNFDVGNCTIYKPNGEMLQWVFASETPINSSFTTLNCTFTLSYYHPNGTYNITITANTTSAQSDTSSTTISYNTLSAFATNETTLNFGTLNVGSSTTLTFQSTNTGNQNLSLQINGTNLVSPIGIIGVGNLTFDTDSNLTNAPKLSTAFQSLLNLTILSSETNWIMLTIPPITRPHNYTGNITINS